MPKRGKKESGKSAPVIRREEPAAPGHHGGAWKVAYADFVTAMMAFFLLMWLLNATTEDQRKGLADYFSPNNLMSHASSGTGQPFGGHTALDDGALVSDRGSVQITAGQHPILQDTPDDPDAIAPEPGTLPNHRQPPPDPQEQWKTALQPPAPPNAAVPAAAEQPAPGPGAGQPSPAGAAPTASAASSQGLARTPAADQPARAPQGQREQGDRAPADPAQADAGQADAGQADAGEDAAAREQHGFERAAREIKAALRRDPALAALAGQLAIDITPEGLRLQLLDRDRQAMFATGSATPNEQARLLIGKIASVIGRLGEQVSIAGYTDAAPYAGRERTNWELSSERANATRRMLVEAGLGDGRVREVTGHADREPLLPAQPLAAANRRIAITLLRNTGREPEPAAAVKPATPVSPP